MLYYPCLVSWQRKLTNMRGITKLISLRFAPNFRYRDVRRRPSNRGGLAYRSARRRGQAVDRALSAWAASGGTACSTRLAEVRAIVAWFGTHLPDFEPVQGQFPVSWADAQLATKLDLLMIDPVREQYLVVEIKCGCMARRCQTVTPHHLTCYPGVDHTLLHQHQLQTVLGTYMFEQMLHVRARMLLLYVSRTGEVEAISGDRFGVPGLNESAKVLSVQYGTRKRRRARGTTCRRPPKRSCILRGARSVPVVDAVDHPQYLRESKRLGIRET